DKIFYTDENNEKYNLTFDEYDNVTFKFKVGHVYKLNIDFKHLPRFIFKDSEGNILGSQWFKDDENNMLTPDINLKAINDKEAEGFYIETNKLKYEVDNSSFSSSVPIPDSVADNYNNIYVITKFRLGKQISIETKEFEEDYAKSISSKIFLRLDGRLQEKYIPKDVDFSWYKGERKGIFNRNSKNTQNNEAFDKRNEFEKEKGVIFEGWYADPQFKNKVEFKDGISTKPFKGSTLYPKFGIHKWDKIRDARIILDLTLKTLSTAVETLPVFLNKNGTGENAKHYLNIAQYSIEIVKWISNLILGGKMTSNDFWDGYEFVNKLIFELFHEKVADFDLIAKLKLNRNLQTIEYLKDDFFQSILWLTKDLARNAFSIYQKYSNNVNKGSAFLDAEALENEWDPERILGYDKERDIERRTKHLTNILYNTSLGKTFTNELYRNSNNNTRCHCSNCSSCGCSTLTNGDCSCCKSKLTQEIIEKKDKNNNKFQAKFIERINNVSKAFAGENGIFDIIVQIANLVVGSISGKVDTTVLTARIVTITTQLARAIKNIVSNKYWYYDNRPYKDEDIK
ncbi:hypothetical protein, partial [Mycoplasma phocimorsus]|uniref:hypothetical protein n=1 Tax=Mycoplasma phocimorsus TaxID=3045839 RepID=UPI0024C0A62C